MELDDVASLLGPTAAVTVADAALSPGGGPLVLRPGRTCPTDRVAEVAARLRALPTVGVVVGHPDQVPVGLAEAADVCLSTVDDPPRPWVAAPVAEVVAAVEAQPVAARALATLLRATEGLSVWDAVASESATYGMLLGAAPFRRWLDRRGPAAPLATGRPPLVVGREDDVLTIELDRPEVHNAVDTAVRDALVETLLVAAVDPSVAEVRLRGRGPTFSSGGDLAEFGTVGDGASAFAVRLVRHPGLAVHAVADRVMAHVHGACAGAGVEVPSFAGRVIADPEATFRLPELSMGLVPGAGGTASLPRRIGRHRTAWLALTGATLDAPAAARWGLVDELAPRARWP